jgi:hypothetical protein
MARGCSECTVGKQELETAVNVRRRKFLFVRQPDVQPHRMATRLDGSDHILEGRLSGVIAADKGTKVVRIDPQDLFLRSERASLRSGSLPPLDILLEGVYALPRMSTKDDRIELLQGRATC